MRDYQRQKNNPYYLPKTLYRRVLMVIRDYDRELEEVKDIIYGTHKPEVMATSGMPGKPTENAAVRLAQYESDIEAVEQALVQIPEEYRKAVFDNIRYGKRFPETAAYRTWLRWRQRFVWYVAKELKLV